MALVPHDVVAGAHRPATQAVGLGAGEKGQVDADRGLGGIGVQPELLEGTDDFDACGSDVASLRVAHIVAGGAGRRLDARHLAHLERVHAPEGG